jgi:fatty acid desaturase
VFDAPIASLKHKLKVAVKSTVGGLVACAAVVIALGFFCAAAFMWLADHYGALTAALVMGAAFTVVALIAVIVILIVQHRKPPPPPARKPAWWADPALLATVLDVSRTLGRRRLATAALVSAFVFGMMLRPPRKGEDDLAE